MLSFIALILMFKGHWLLAILIVMALNENRKEV